ncbi:hypothetical protein Tco_0667951, partial [Tanacetum coccineum]
YWIYEWNKDVPWVDEKPWTDTGVWTKPTPVKHTCKPFNYKTGCSEWPTYSWKDDGYCNGGNLPGAYIIGNQLHYQDYEWYEALENCKLKDEALRNKVIMEGSIKEDDDESRYEQKRQWNTYTNYDDAYEINHKHNKSKELCEVHEQPVCNIRRYMMIKYSFNDDEEYVAVKEDEYDDLTITRKEACRAYQEIFQIMDEGWMVRLEIFTLQMGMYISSQSSCDFTTITIIGESEDEGTIKEIIRNYYCDNRGLSILHDQCIERDRLIGIGFVLDFMEFISFTFGDKEMILVIEAVQWSSDYENPPLHKRLAKLVNASRERTNKILRKPTWNNAQRVNKQNQFVPLAVQTRTGTNPVNTAKASSTNNFSTARHSVNRQTVLTSTALKVNTVKPMMSDVRSANDFHKTNSPSSRPFKRTTVLKTNLSNQKVYTAKVKEVSTVGEKWVIAVKSSASCKWRIPGYNKNILSKYNGGSSLRNYSSFKDPLGRLKPTQAWAHDRDKKVTFFIDFQDFNGGLVAFGAFNSFHVSHTKMCDKKNKVLFTDTECLVLSPDFKLPDENQILLKVPRQNNMYSFNLENIVPLGGLACLIAKATTDESNLWHRRLGHGSKGNTTMLKLHNKMELLRERTGPLLRLQGPCLQIHFYLTLFGHEELGTAHVLLLTSVISAMPQYMTRLYGTFNCSILNSYSLQNFLLLLNQIKEKEVQERRTSLFWKLLQSFKSKRRKLMRKLKALTKNLEQENENLVTQGEAAITSGTNIISTISTTAKASGTNFVNTVSIPVGTTSANEGLSISNHNPSQKMN